MLSHLVYTNVYMWSVVYTIWTPRQLRIKMCSKQKLLRISKSLALLHTTISHSFIRMNIYLGSILPMIQRLKCLYVKKIRFEYKQCSKFYNYTTILKKMIKQILQQERANITKKYSSISILNLNNNRVMTIESPKYKLICS